MKMIFSTISVLLLIAGTAFAQQEDPPAEEPPVAPPTEEEASEDPPSLDDLLGIETERDSEETDAAAESERQRGLDRALAEEEPSAAFKQAILDMDETAVLLRNDRATGLGTQRLQVRIVERLQALIDSARRQQQQQPSQLQRLDERFGNGQRNNPGLGGQHDNWKFCIFLQLACPGGR